jgi:hypothetical protein
MRCRRRTGGGAMRRLTVDFPFIIYKLFNSFSSLICNNNYYIILYSVMQNKDAGMYKDVRNQCWVH